MYVWYIVYNKATINILSAQFLNVMTTCQIALTQIIKIVGTYIPNSKCFYNLFRKCMAKLDDGGDKKE